MRSNVPSTRRSTGTAVSVLLATTLLAGSFPVLAAKRPKPEPCPSGRYLIVGEPLVAGENTPTTDGLQVGTLVAIDELCGPVAPKALRAHRNGVTDVHAKWSTCNRLAGKVRLDGKLIDGCSRFKGTLKAHKFKRQFEAVLSRCGDGIVDPGAGEQCDDGNTVPGDGCEPDCRVTPPTTTTTTLAPPTTTSITATTSTTTSPTSSTTTLVTTTSSTSSTTTSVTTTTSTSTTTTSFRATTTSTTATTSTTVATTTTTFVTTTTFGGTTSTTTSTSTTTTTLPMVELGLAMVVNPDPVTLGGLLTWSLTVTNPGTVDASGVLLRMPVPSGLYGTAGCRAVSDGGVVPVGCVAGRDIVWDLGTLAAAASRTVQFVGLVTVSGLTDGTVIHATARTAESTGTASANAQVDAVVVASPPLALTLDEDRDPVGVGDTLEYALRFGNRSASPLLTTTLALMLPSGTTVLDAGGATVTSGTATWSLGTLNGGQAGERRLRVRVDDLGAADPLVRVAHAMVTSGANVARATALTQVEPAALDLSMTANPDPIGLQDLLTYTLTVTNRRAVDAAGIVLLMRVPEGLYGTAGCRAVSDAGILPAGCAAGEDIEWDLGGLAAGASRTVQFVGLVTVGPLPDGSLIHATARVADATGAAARAEVTTTVENTAPLVLTLDEDRDPVGFGDTLEYVLRFGNRSASPLLTTTLALTLPPGTTVLDAGGATVTGDTATWALGTLNGGQAGEQRLQVRVDDLGAADPLVRAARAVLASGVNATRAAAVTQVEPAAALDLVVTANPDPIGLQDLLTYTLTVTNRRAVDAAGVVLLMQVPEGLYGTAGCRAVSDAGILPAGCTAGRDIEWDLGGLAAGASRTVQFVGLVTVGPLPDGSLIHATARVVDVTGTAARAEVTTTVENTAPLVLTLDEDHDPVAFGDTVRYALRFGNRSTSVLSSTTLALTLPPGATVLDAGGATVTGDTATWALGAVNGGQAGTRGLQVRVDDLGAADPLVRVARAVAASGANVARAAAVTQVEQAAPLDLAMVATPDPVARAGLLTYALTVTNNGAVDLAGVVLLMPVPEGLYGTAGCRSVSDGGILPAGCAAGRDIEWDLGALAAGASRTVQFVGEVTLSGLPNGNLIHATARVSDVSGASARAATTTTVSGG